MANHRSALKRVRSDEAKRLHKTARNAIRALRSNSNKKEVEEKMPKVFSMIDKLAKRNIIHKNKAANLKSSITRHATSL